MTLLLDQVMRLARPADRAVAATALGRLLGGERLLLFVRDREVGVLLPAPGFPQTLRNAREWQRMLNASVTAGECAGDLTPPEGGDRVPSFAFSAGPDVVSVILGARARPQLIDELRDLLPLLESLVHTERAADHAHAREVVATQAAAHAQALAAAFNQSRNELHHALTEAESARREAALASEQLAEQAAELEVQTEELATQAEELKSQADRLHATNAELMEARKVADTANEAKSLFLATMSHELRTPLNAIGGHVQLIQLGIYGPVTDEQRVALDRVNRSQVHLLGLINNILNLARIESGRLEYNLADLQLDEVFADLAPMVEPQYRSKQLAYSVTICDPTLTVRADKEKLEQILLNLLSNAIKFTPAGGSIDISCASRADVPDTVFIRVIDSGVGVPDEKLEAIFEPFVQVDAGHSRANEGTGLGLAISRDLARGMGGDLRVRSVFGEGSTFTLALPRGQGPTT